MKQPHIKLSEVPGHALYYRALMLVMNHLKGGGVTFFLERVCNNPAELKAISPFLTRRNYMAELPYNSRASYFALFNKKSCWNLNASL
jgi:hypothetical protein